jgi:riboflavin kinase/FMN adenylyltransferase
VLHHSKEALKFKLLLKNSLSYHRFMQVWTNSENWAKEKESEKDSLKGAQGSVPIVMTIGNFDGVHCGHQELLKKTVQKAREINGFSLLLTFHPHPAQILAPERKHKRLFSLEDQQEQLIRQGLDGVFRQDFSREFSEIPANDFLENYILKEFHPAHLVVGHDFHFGAHRKGTLELLQSFCQKHRISLELVPALKIEQKIVSTSQIRQQLLDGNVQLAKALLGRSYYLQGIVEKGEARGRQLGFPTANIRPDVDFYPKMGVYVCQVHGAEPNGKVLRAVMNLGMNRTFVEGDHHPIKAEVHILDFEKDLYGQKIKVELLHYLREEKKFASLEELKTQIQRDVQTARSWSAE